MDIRYDQNGIAVNGEGQPFIKTDLFQTEIDPTKIISREVDPQDFFEDAQVFIEENYEMLKKCYILLNEEAAIVKMIENERDSRKLSESILKAED